MMYGIDFFVKQKTEYEMHISDGSSDVCSSDLLVPDCDHIARKLCKAEASPRSKAGTVAARIRSKDLVLVRKIADEPVPHRGTPGNRMAERQPGSPRLAVDPVRERFAAFFQRCHKLSFCP